MTVFILLVLFLAIKHTIGLTIMSNREQQICDFGLHQGESYTKLPASFLNWMVGNNHEKSALAKQELKRRQLAASRKLNCPDGMKTK